MRRFPNSTPFWLTLALTAILWAVPPQAVAQIGYTNIYLPPQTLYTQPYYYGGAYGGGYGYPYSYPYQSGNSFYFSNNNNYYYGGASRYSYPRYYSSPGYIYDGGGSVSPRPRPSGPKDTSHFYSPGNSLGAPRFSDRSLGSPR